MVNDERVSIMYEGDGQNKTFAYPYSFTRKEDIIGYVISNGKTKRVSTNFEFNPVTKQYMYPKNGTPLARNESILLTRETPRNNTLQLPNEPIYTALQGQLDKIVRMIQELGSHHKGIPSICALILSILALVVVISLVIRSTPSNGFSTSSMAFLSRLIRK